MGQGRRRLRSDGGLGGEQLRLLDQGGRCLLRSFYRLPGGRDLGPGGAAPTRCYTRPMVTRDGSLSRRRVSALLGGALCAALTLTTAVAQEQRDTIKPTLHGKHWVAVAGKPLGATAGAKIFERGGNAVDAACGMLAALATMWDTLSWGGETQALIHDPRSGKVRAINALGKVGLMLNVEKANLDKVLGVLPALAFASNADAATYLACYGAGTVLADDPALTHRGPSERGHSMTSTRVEAGIPSQPNPAPSQRGASSDGPNPPTPFPTREGGVRSARCLKGRLSDYVSHSQSRSH